MVEPAECITDDSCLVQDISAVHMLGEIRIRKHEGICAIYMFSLYCNFLPLLDSTWENGSLGKKKSVVQTDGRTFVVFGQLKTFHPFSFSTAIDKNHLILKIPKRPPVICKIN